MTEFKIEFVGTPNYTKGRGKYSPIAIVNHITSGNMPGCLEWLQTPKAQASANYIVTREGRILQLVADEDTAWANGNVRNPNWRLLIDGANPNKYTISIEHEGFENKELTDIQYQATLFLHRVLLQKFNIPITENTIIGHCNIDSVVKKNCPGKCFPWKKLFSDLIGGEVEKLVEQWMIDLGTQSVNKLAEKGVVKNPAEHISLLANPTENWLFWTMLCRIYDEFDNIYNRMGGR